jgi:hypothetical protein
MRTGTLSSSCFGKFRGLPYTRTVFATASRSCPPEPEYPVSCMTTTIPRGTIAISAASRMRIPLRPSRGSFAISWQMSDERR